MKAGWYWVKWHEGDLNWESACINCIGIWLRAGVDEDRVPHPPDIIGPRIEPPPKEWKPEGGDAP